MPDSYTETSTQGFFSRILGSFLGVLLGPVVIIAAVILLWWNEGRAVEAIVGLNSAASAMVELADANPGAVSEGKLVHVVGPATATTAITDNDLSVSFPSTVAAARKVEMYEWQEKSQSNTSNNLGGSQTTTTTYSYSQVWSEMPIDSGNFHHPEGHTNPGMPFKSTTFAASDAKLGGFTLDPVVLSKLTLTQDATPATASGWTKSGDELYKGDVATPKTGDLRVSYTSLPSGTTMSVLAQQSHGGFAQYTAPNGYTVELAAVGNEPAATMITNERKSEAMWTWILRAVGVIAMIVGIAMFMGPLGVIASVIPFLGSLVRGASFFAAIVIGLPVSLIVIALAWIGHRPIIGGGILLLAVLIFLGLRQLHGSRAKAA